MWIFTIYGFFSISVFAPGVVNIRARSEQHLKNLQERFPILKGKEILMLKEADYHYRIEVPKETWELILLMLGREQEWSNFKSMAHEVTRPEDSLYLSSLHKVWDTMYLYQTKKAKQEKGVK